MAAAAPGTPPARPVVTIGNFDGVHLGHRAVLRAARVAAGADPLVVVTFTPHPLRVLRPDRAPAVLTQTPAKVALLRAAGVDRVWALPFDDAVAAWSPRRFVEQVLRDGLHARAVVVGENFRFGHGAAGDVDTLRRLGRELGFAVVPAPLATAADGRRVSSSAVRAHLAAGEVDPAAADLGRPYRLPGTVVHGDHRGRELGYPTANLEVDTDPDGPMAVPADGIYAVRLHPGPGSGEDGAGLPAVLSVGTNPTFDGVARRVEAHVLDRDDLDLYGEHVSLDLLARQRPTVRFDSVAALLDQMAADVARTRQLLA